MLNGQEKKETCSVGQHLLLQSFRAQKLYYDLSVESMNDLSVGITERQLRKHLKKGKQFFSHL